MDYFWNHEYRHDMRDLKDSVKKEVYNTFIEFGLKPNGKSDLHYQLICEVIGDYLIEGEIRVLHGAFPDVRYPT